MKNTLAGIAGVGIVIIGILTGFGMEVSILVIVAFVGYNVIHG